MREDVMTEAGSDEGVHVAAVARRHVEGRARIHLSMKDRKFGAALLDQQLWCIGRDIFHPDGNALLRYGMTCARVPVKQKGSHAYTHAASETRRMTLWGFGMFFGDDALGGLFIRRFTMEPRHTPVARLSLPLWKVAQLPDAAEPRTCARVDETLALASAAFEWMAAYERWISETHGVTWREACVAAWHQRRCVDGAAMAGAWLELRERIQSAAIRIHEDTRDQRRGRPVDLQPDAA